MTHCLTAQLTQHILDAVLALQESADLEAFDPSPFRNGLADLSAGELSAVARSLAQSRATITRLSLAQSRATITRLCTQATREIQSR
jgi:hypothetical protein